MRRFAPIISKAGDRLCLTDRWEEPVPAIHPKYLTCTVYMYPSIQAAERGDKAGGTGFFVGFPAPDGSERHFRYLVTNRHVIEAGCLTLRVAMRDGSSEAGETKLDQWTIAADDDLAVAGIGVPEGHDTMPFAPDVFLAEDCRIDGWPIYPGDDVMFYGRLITHDGRQKNKPVLRFGSIAMMPDADALIDFGSHQQLGFLVECRSVSGFSGSPAFVHLAQPRMAYKDVDGLKWIPSHVRFLGVNCGHLPYYSPARERPSANAKRVPDVWAENNSGIAVVIPAWRLWSLLNQEHLVKQRTEIWADLDQAEHEASIAVPDAARSAPPDEPFTKADFEQALKKTSRRLSDEDKSET